MSGKQTGKVWDLDVSGRQQLVLLALADNAHHDGTNCFPGNELLAWKTGYSVRTIKRVLAELRDPAAAMVAGHQGPLVEAVAHQRGGRGHRTEYHLHLDRGKKKEPFEPGAARKRAKLAPIERVPNEHVNGDKPAHERVPGPAAKGDTHAGASKNRHEPLDGSANEPTSRALARVGEAGDSTVITIPRGSTPRAVNRLRRTAQRIGADLIHEGSSTT